DWSLAIAAYNCGPGNVNKARRRAGEANSDFWEIYNYLPSETRGYVPAFIAANFVMNYHDDYGIHRPLIKRPLITDTVEVRERVHFNQIANVLNIPVDEIRMLNPQYRKDVIPGSPNKPYVLTLPSQQVLSYISSRDDILAYESEKYTPRTTVDLGRNKNRDKRKDDADTQQETEQQAAQQEQTVAEQPILADAVTRTTHTVGRGEDLGSIAKHYGVSATDIKHWNNLRRGKVREGDKLVIELRQRNAVLTVDTRKDAQGKTMKSDVPMRQTKTTAPSQNKAAYTAVPERSRQSAAPTRSVPQRNSEKYKQNQRSRAAQAAESKKSQKSKTKAKPQKPIEHNVKSGESLEKIAKRHGTTVDALRKANGMKKDATNLQIGQKLKIPGKTATAEKSSKASKSTKKGKDSKSKSAQKSSKKNQSKSTKNNQKSSKKKGKKK
ncbi:MAG: LysM peptidoglycan-binding domain-containing protein, partial [Bacteroides sp.]|nr:LysM peptidoglycan-binding domain-containing protein [Bacteroides sp.]